MSPTLAVRIATYLLVADGLAALFLAGLIGPLGLAVVGAALALSWWQEPLRARVHTRGLGAALAAAAAIGSAADLLFLADTLLDGLVHLLLFLVLARIFTLRAPGDSRVVAFLSFFMLVAASSGAFGVGFLFVFVACLLLSTWMLLLQHVLAESAPHAGRVIVGIPPQLAWGRGLLGLAAGAAAATLLITAALFFVIPRVGLAALPFRAKLGPLVTGFTDRVELGAYGQIETDASMAMRVHIPEGMGAAEEIPGLRWRGIVFDEFDGRAWTVGQPDRMAVRRSMTADFRLGGYRGQGRILRQEFYLEPIGTEVIFAAPRILRLEARAREITVDDMGSVSIAQPSARLHYIVESELEAPRAGVPDAWGFASADDPAVARYLQLPPLPARIPALAREVTAGSRSPYEAARRLNEHLAREFAYTLALERRTTLPPLEEFLFVRRAGNCEYFAASLAVMLRSLGVPARVVGGFQRGEWNPYGRYFAVRMRDAHSWVEAYFPSAGWLSFDPSPRAAAEAGRSTLALYLDALRMRWYRYVINWSLRDQVEVAVGLRRQAGNWGTWVAALRETPAPRAVWPVIALAAAAAVALVLYRGRSAPAARAARRMPRFYARALRALARRGLRPSPGETAREFCARAAAAVPGWAEPVAAITVAYERARFGALTLTAAEEAALEGSLAALARRRAG
ncbi:MAG: DUF3488 domain-containing protein [Candidatus Rokubacteria bacterium]|nr:DUF3488 domain-containing protein [Candidatus Rokubacteria bacterium]